MINWGYAFAQFCVFRADNAKEWSFIPEEEKVKLTLKNGGQIQAKKNCGKIKKKYKNGGKSKPIII